jgi:Flp pilus assembly protein TadG
MGPAHRRDDGQAAVELALALPVVLVLLFGIVQVGLLVQAQVLLVHAAREAAREVAVQEASQTADRAADRTALARRAALAAVGDGLDAGRLSIEVTDRGGRVGVRAGYRAPIALPLVRFPRKDVRLAAFAELRREID